MISGCILPSRGMMKSLFDFVDPSRNAALKVADRGIVEQEPDVLNIHLEQFLLLAVPADPAAYISKPLPSGGSSVFAAEAKKPIRVRVTGRKYMAVGAATSTVSVGVSVPAGGVAVTSAAAELVSPTRVSKKHKIIPTLTAYQAVQAAYAMPIGSTAGVQVEGVSSAPLTSVDAMPSATSGPRLSELISKASAATVSCSMPPPMPTTVVAVTTSPVSTPLPSSVTPTSPFDSPFSVFSASEKEMPTVSAAHEATSAGDTAAEDDLKRVTANLAEERILWACDIADKDRVLAHAKTVQEELERKAVVEAQKGLTVELEASHAKVQAKQAELEEREEQLRKLQQVCDSLVSDKYKLVESSATHQARLKEVEDVLEQSNTEVDSLTSQMAELLGDRNWLITNGLVGAFEYLRQSESFTALLDRLSAAAYQSSHHDGVYKGYFECQQSEKITPAFHTKRGKLQGDMADTLEAACNDLLPSYADLMDKVTEDGVDSLRLMLDPAEESGEE
ncbi:hypothetical protein HanIR_Chr04g0166191 [Helianthus annuus]|nr:hypothetical protein HanIR_Chr04g0166191 [Helianthus annuus]